MASLSGFDANQVKDTGFDLLPVAEYQAVITESELKKANSGNFAYFNFTFEIIDGEYTGRKIWQRITQNSDSEKARNIGKAQLASICRAVGKMTPNDTEELHDLPMLIRVGIEKGTNGYPDRNKITVYKPAGTTQPTKAPPASATATSGSAPWSRK